MIEYANSRVSERAVPVVDQKSRPRSNSVKPTRRGQIPALDFSLFCAWPRALAEEPYIVHERRWLSHCVESSIRRLSQHLPEGRTLTAADIFADIARTGSGESVWTGWEGTKTATPSDLGARTS